MDALKPVFPEKVNKGYHFGPQVWPRECTMTESADLSMFSVFFLHSQSVARVLQNQHEVFLIIKVILHLK